MTSEDHFQERDFELRRALGRPRTVLDVGCGRGSGGEFARAKGAVVAGIGVKGAGLPSYLDESLEADVEDASAAAALGSRRFDVVVFGDVLEHVRQPQAVLDRFVPFLEDGGRVLISIANDAAWAERARRHPHGHARPRNGDNRAARLTRDAAARLVSQAGLELLWIGYDPAIEVARPFGPRRPGSNGKNGSGPRSASDDVIHRAFVRPVQGWMASLAPGAFSLRTIVVARKPPVRRKLTCTVGMLSMNEEQAVARVIDDIRTHAPDAEILLVDSSKDRTPQIAADAGARVIRQVPPRGYGPAMDTLLYGANGEVVITMDCDGTYPADRIPELRTLVEEGGADLVNASRTRHRPASMPLPNYVANRAFAVAANLAHGIHTTDMHSGMRAYRASMLRSIDVDPKGQALPVELLVAPARCGFHVVDVEIPYHHRIGVSTLHRWQSTVWTFRRLAHSAVGPRARRDRWTTR